MLKDINEIMLNPVRMRIVQELATRKNMTTIELCDTISDVSRTTMYRHINILLDNNILTVVSEKKIRGSLERTLALNIEELSKNNTIENASQNAFGFLMNRYIRFHNYFSGENSNPGKDKIFFNNSVLMMDDNEFDQFLLELKELIIKYNFKATEGRKARDISIISSPVDEDKKGKNS
ncbi:helix-turn-helix domain-containing protein [Clostridium sp. D2Q-11]|uniref:Helix-turn-helix domain-containing protein n=1 Tax=Anaeromonas frigoriresistens TaxID=2683708 RepID=A0A942Z5Z3_9FIRM|nr:helix-turn-helix domain-containing protein [Anaeromonas frigoriresistens]MBS4537951.1 helix-turn-helix domain-containing protein [Anaeromonas frigoriresistens]